MNALNDEIISRYCTIAASALLVWHHLLTLDREVSHFWRRRPSAACALFLANRYVCLVYSIYNLFYDQFESSYTGPSSGCAAGSITQWCVYSAQYVIWAVFSSLRVYALGRKRTWAVLVLLLSLAPVVTYTATLRLKDFVMIPSFGCAGVVHAASQHLYQSLLILTRACLVVADLIVVAFTWASTRRYGSSDSESRRFFGKVTMLSGALRRNGTIYFVVLTAINILYLLSDALSLATSGESTPAAFFATVMYGAFSSLTAILITHFLADLQEAASASVHLGSLSESGASEGSLGVLQFVRADVDVWIEESLRSVPAADDEDER